MTARRLSADAKARIAFTHDRLSRALELAMFARRAGRVSRKTLAVIATLKRDHERAIEGKTVAEFDAFGGRSRWENRQDQSGSAHGEQPIVNRKAGAARHEGSTPPPGTKQKRRAA